MSKLSEYVETHEIFEVKDFYYPCFNSIMGLYSPTTAAIYGIIFNLSKKLGYSTASIEAIALRAGVSPATAKRTLKKLKQEGLIEDVTPERSKWQKGKYGNMKQVRHYKPNLWRHDELKGIWANSEKNPINKNNSPSNN